MANTILLKRSDVSNSVPSTGNLVQGELALNFTDGNLFFKDSSNNVVLLSSTKLVSVTGNVTGNNIIGNTLGQFGNITISGSNINSDAASIVVNSNNADVDFAVNGDTIANVFYVDAGTDTVSIGNSTQINNAVLSLNSTNSLVIPRGNNSQRPDPAQVGMLRFNNETDTVEFYTDAEGWQSAAQQFTLITSQTFIGTGYSTVFTLNTPQTTNSVIVSLNGVVQVPVTAYSVSGTTLTFTSAPGPGYAIEVRSLTTTTTVTQLSNSNNTAVVAVSDTSGTVNITGNVIPTANAAQSLGNATNTWNSVYASGNITGNYFIGNGSLLTGIDATSIQNGTSNVRVVGANGNVTFSINSTGNVVVVDSTGANITGTLSATGNITGGNVSGTNLTGTLLTAAQTNITSVGTLGALTVTGNISSGNLITAGLASLSSIVKTGSNGVGNIGSASNAFDTVFARSTSSLYADLAENYLADAEYEPGTVLVFGGSAEVTMADKTADTRIAGVVTTKPSYVMNSGLVGDHVVTVALLGRVPCKVFGPVSKGSMLVSAGDGYASACTEPKLGSVIGKSLENFTGTEGVVEVVVGKI